MDNTRVLSKQRIQFDFTPEALKRLEDLKEQVEASTKAEVIRNALKLYEWFVTEVDPNYVIEVKDKEGNTIFRIPAKVLLS
ncbi:MAG TPA: hypothetical protein VJ761_23325 [Ktedonobacteraceae bacterium]|nr:hypothetical protein [Ktedonobacteraceae bacterium]